MKKEFKIISELFEHNTRVLDVGCGDGTLMKYLKDKKNVGFAEITSDKGHDSFLLDVPDFLNTIKNFLNTSYNKLNEKRI